MEWMAEVFPTWVELLVEQPDSILMLPHYTQHEILQQVTLLEPFNSHQHKGQ